MDLMKKLMDSINTRVKPRTICEHYGMKEKDYDTMARNILKDFLTFPTKNEVIDKNFPKLDSDDRIKVVAFSQAMSEFKKLGCSGCDGCDK